MCCNRKKFLPLVVLPFAKPNFSNYFLSENCHPAALCKHALAAARGDQSYKTSLSAENYCKIFLHRRRLVTFWVLPEMSENRAGSYKFGSKNSKDGRRKVRQEDAIKPRFKFLVRTFNKKMSFCHHFVVIYRKYPQNFNLNFSNPW